MNANWKRMRFKGNKVWMAVDSEDRPLLEKGKALIKYQLDQPHEYRVHPKNILSLDEEQTKSGNAAPPARKKKEAPSRKRPPAPSGIDATADIPGTIQQNA